MDREGVVENGDNALLDTQRLVAQPILVQHVVRLVEHEHLHFRHVDHLSPDQVRHRPRSADDDLRCYVRCALGQAFLDRVLSLNWCELAHCVHDRHDLPRELS